MGRKSNAKKARRKAESKKEETEKKDKGLFKKVFKKENRQKKTRKSEKKPKPEKPKKRKQLKINRKKLFGWAFAVIMLAILISVGHLLFQKAFRAKPIAKLLPADTTIASLEVNLNFEHNQLLKTFHLLRNHPEYSREKLIGQIERRLQVDYEKDLKPWLGRSAGIAVLNPIDPKDTIHTVYFVEYLNRSRTERFLNRYRPSKITYGETAVYQLEGQVSLVFIDDYIFFGPKKQAIYDLIDSGPAEKLYGSGRYRKIDNNLPLNKLAYFYTDFEKISDSLFKTYALLGENGLSMEILQPFLKLFDAEGLAVIATDQNFAIQSFLSLNSGIVDKIEYMEFQEKYNANLASYITPDVLVFWGGENLEAQMKRLLQLLSGGEESTMMVFEGLLQNYTKKYFGPDVNFTNDVLPLFHNEFAFVVEKSGEKNNYKLLLELDSPQRDALNIHEIANSFARVGAIFEPKVVEHTLEDGTVGKEIVAVPEEIVQTESNYNGYTITELVMGKQGWGIYYSLVDDVALITTDQDSIRESIDIAMGNKPGLKSIDLFVNHIEPVLKSSDEVSFFNLEGLLPLLLKEEIISDYPVFTILSSFSSGRNYFNDGVVTINYLHVK